MPSVSGLPGPFVSGNVGGSHNPGIGAAASSPVINVKIGTSEASFSKEQLKKVSTVFKDFLTDTDSDTLPISYGHLSYNYIADDWFEPAQAGLPENHAFDNAFLDYLQKDTAFYARYPTPDDRANHISEAPKALITPENALYFFNLAEMLDLEDLKTQVLDAFASTALLDNLSDEARRTLLKYKTPELRSAIIKRAILKNSLSYRFKHLPETLLASLMKIFESSSKSVKAPPTLYTLLDNCVKCGLIPSILADGTLAIEVKGQCSEKAKENLKALNKKIPISKLILGNNGKPSNKTLNRLSEAVPKIKSLTISNSNTMPKTWLDNVEELNCINCEAQSLLGDFSLILPNAKRLTLIVVHSKSSLHQKPLTLK